MKFTINKNEFLKGLLLVGKISSGINPIYATVKMELDKNGLTLCSSNGDLSITSRIPFFINDKEIIRDVKEGGILVNAHLITEITRKSESEELTFEVFEDEVAQIQNEKSSYKLNCIRIEEYPDIDFNRDGVQIDIPTKDFLEAINSVAFAAATKDTRPVLAAINIESDVSGISFSATDTSRLAVNEVDLESATISQRFCCNIPSKSLSEVAKTITTEQDVTIYINDKKALFALGDILIATRLIPGDYPNVKNIIPKSFFYILEVNASEFLSAMDRVSLFSGERSNAVKLTMSSNGILISSKSQQVGSGEERLNLFKYSGDRLEITFNCQFVSEAIRALKSEDVTLNFLGANKPFLVASKSNPKNIQLVTPIRQN